MKFNNCDFVHIHNHSSNSLFDGLSSISSLVSKAREMNFPAIAITDHGNVGSLIKFIKECSATKDKKDNPILFSKIKPILGFEAYLARKKEWKSKEFQPDGRKGNRHLCLFAKNYKGYQNLCSLSEISWLEGFYTNPRIDIETLADYSEGLMCSSACLSSVINANLLYDRYDKAKRICTIFKDIFKEDFFLEVMYHGIDSEGLIIPDIFKLGKELDIPVLASNDCHYLEKSKAASQEVYMCMSTSKCLSDPKHLHFPYGEFYLKSAQEMAVMFGHVPQVLYNTVAFAERIDYEDINKNLFGGMRLPQFEAPEQYSKDFEGRFKYLEDMAWAGMKKKGWDKSEKHIETLKMELADTYIVWKNNEYDFARYFLIEQDLMNFASENGILTMPGRGSGFSSVLLHCIGVAYGVDPLDGYNMLWGRFLGFENKRIVKESDFGFKEEIDVSKIIENKELMAEEEEVVGEDEFDEEVDDDESGSHRVR